MSIFFIVIIASIARLAAFDEFERLAKATQPDTPAYLVVLLGGEAGMRCGQLIALEWTDVDLERRRLRVARSEWRGHVSTRKGGRIRHVPLTKRLVSAVKDARHLRAPRVLCDADGQAFTQKMIPV